MNKIKNAILYPWFSIWIYPRKTLRYMSIFQNRTTLFLLYTLAIFSSLDTFEEERIKEVFGLYGNAPIPTGLIGFSLDIFSLYIAVWIFKRKKNLQKSAIIMLLTSIPFGIYRILLWLDIRFAFLPLEYNESTVTTFSILYLLWLIIVSFILIQEVFKFSKIKTFIVMLVAMLLSFLSYRIVLYLPLLFIYYIRSI
jgi:hypothetical protein